MKQRRDSATLALPTGALDLLMPLSCVIGPTGHVRHIATTLGRVLGAGSDGCRFLELFELRRPRGIETFGDLLAAAPCPVRIRIRQSDVAMQGQAVAIGGGEVLINLAFAVAGLAALDRFGLGAHDFPPTDATADLLYLTEAKNAAMAEAERLTAQLLRENAAALKQAVTDPLTGLLNRRGLDQTLRRIQQDRQPFVLMHLDLDRFKQVNDTLGHAEGDRVLMLVAEALRLELRGSDVIGRVGGDEFIIALRGHVDREVVSRIAARIIRRIEGTAPSTDTSLGVSASIGIVTADRHELRLDDLHAAADRALYAAKGAGRRTHCFADAVAPRAERRTDRRKQNRRDGDVRPETGTNAKSPGEAAATEPVDPRADAPGARPIAGA